MSYMFAGATSFNQPLDKWDVSSVKTMRCMFQNAASFNQPMDKWDVSSVKDMAGMRRVRAQAPRPYPRPGRAALRSDIPGDMISRSCDASYPAWHPI
jgi:surface protein